LIPEILERKDLSRVLDSTRKYYEAYSNGYVKFYNDWVKGEDVFSNPAYKEGYDKVAEVLVNIVRRGELVVNVGCGVETLSTLLARNQAYVVSLDYPPKTLIKCGEKARSLKVESQVLRILADGFYLPFQKQTFVGATLNWVLAHIPANKNFMFLREISRVLKADGWLVISDSYWKG